MRYFDPQTGGFRGFDGAWPKQPMLGCFELFGVPKVRIRPQAGVSWESSSSSWRGAKSVELGLGVR